MDTKKKIIIGICVVAIIVAIYFGYKSLAKTLGLDDNPGNGDYKPNNGNTTGGGGSGSAGGSSNAGTENNSGSQDNKTNNDSPVLYEVGEKLFTYGEYANVRQTAAVINKTIDNNLLGTVKGEIGIVEAVVNSTNKNDTHKWYKVKLTTPIRKMLFLEYEKGYVRDDVVTNQK